MHDAGAFGVEMGGMGAFYRGLGWSEIAAWVDGADMRDLDPFWRRQVMALSAALAGAMNKATEPETPAPYEP